MSSPAGPFDAARRVLERALQERVAPAIGVEVGRSAGPAWHAALGALTGGAGAPAVTRDTVFDLASLTKVVATTTLALGLVERGRLELEAPVAGLLAGWRGADRERVTVEDLLAHCSGLPGTLPLYESCAGREQFERAIGATPLQYAPRSGAVYSDLGFILLGFVIEDAARAPLDAQVEELSRGLQPTGHAPFGYRRMSREASFPACIAPTRRDPWRGRLLCGEVDDSNAAALDGVAGHAGLFGTTSAVGAFAGAVLRTSLGRADGGLPGGPATLARFLRRTSVPGSSRARGWDTMLPTSSCGTRMSARAFGHTGFTGTSLWIDPAADLYVVLLTNRVHPEAGSPEPIRALRRALHDAVMEELG